MTSDHPSSDPQPTGVSSDAAAPPGWSAWSGETFEAARSRNLPVLMLLANAWSARCGAAVRSLAIDEALDGWLRERVELVAVDTDERPDLAARYLAGSPPEAVVLTPDGDPIGRAEQVSPAALRAAVTELHGAWSTRQHELLHEAETERITRAAERATSMGRRSPGVLTPAILDVALEVLDDTALDALDATAAGEAIRLWRYAHLRRGAPGALEQAQRAAWAVIAAGRFEGELGAVHHAPDDDAIAALDQATVLTALAELALADAEAHESLQEPIGRMAGFLVDVLGDPYGGFHHAATGLDAGTADGRIFTRSSARVARALMLAGVAYEERRWVELGRRGVDFLLEHLRAGEAGVYHRWEDGAAGGFGFLGDQAEVLLAALQAYEVSGVSHYLDHAQRLARIVERDWREPGRGFRDLSDLVESEAADGSSGLLGEAHTPIGENAAMAEALLWLARLTHDERLLDVAVETMAVFGVGLERHGVALPSYARVVDRMLSAEPEIKVVAEQPPGEPDRVADPLVDAALRLPVAGRTVQRLTLHADDDLIRQLGLPLDVPRVAYVCIGTSCSAPLQQPEQLLPAVEEMIESPVG